MKQEEHQETIISATFEETQQFGQKLAQKLSSGSVLALYGDLGSGKTTFVQGLAMGLGITKKIISPTFIIMRTYKIEAKSPRASSRNFYHVDLYRIESEKDVEGIGLLELIDDNDNIVVIEWPDKIEHLLPESRINLYFEYLGDNRRRISVGHTIV